MENNFIAHSYHITTDPNFQNELFGNTPELIKQFQTLFLEAQDKKNKKIIDKLINLSIQHPKSPQLKNFLSVAYNVQGMREKAIEVNNWILTEHPDYLFGKLNQANSFIENKQPEKVPEILGELMELKSLYPDRDIFHLTEVTSYYKISIRYFTAIENLELAENRLEVLEDIAPGHSDTEDAGQYVFALRMKKGIERWETERKKRITPEMDEKPLPQQTADAPVFNHFKIEKLYSTGLAITPENLKEILELPRETLIKDLEEVLSDAANRFDYFYDLGWEEETHNFPIHAIFLLTELKATESLPKIISFLEYGDEFLEFWVGNHKTETLWRCFYGLGFHQTETLKHLLLRKGFDTYIKSEISEALCQMVLHHPEKRNEIVSIYSEVLTKNNQASLNDNLIDSDFLGLMIGNIADCRITELLPLIKELYEKEYVSLGINGTYKEVEKELSKVFDPRDTKEIYGIENLYKHVLTTWAGYKDNDESENDFFNYLGDYTPQLPVIRTEPKIGRNDPCHCGSGKKFKKCHGQ